MTDRVSAPGAPPLPLEILQRFRHEDHVEEKSRSITVPGRGESFAMMLVTGVYLVFELAFAARLLDVVGTTLDPDDIHQIEIAGRIISGIALTLVVWSAFILPRLRRAPWRPFRRLRGFAALSTSAVLCCALSYGVQEAILDGISHASSPEKRQAAATLTLIAASVQDETAVLKGMDFTDVDRNSPEARSFFALLPALALATDDLPDRTQTVLDDLLRFQAEKAVGDFETFYNEVYVPSSTQMIRLYNAYLPAAEQHRKARLSAGSGAEEMHRRYLRSLGRVRPDQIPRTRYGRVRSQVIASGVPVAEDWRPTDRQGFLRAARTELLRRADFAYGMALRPVLDFRPPDDLGPQAFFALAEIQDLWRDRIGMTQAIALEVSLSPDEARRRIHDPWIAAIASERRPLYHAPLSEFAPGGSWHEDGITAIRIAWIPLIALGISLLGALVHIFKTGSFALQAVIGMNRKPARLAVKTGKVILGSALIGLAVIVSQIDNSVTRSELFLTLEERTAQRMHPVMAGVMRTVIQLQPFAYPVAETLRRDLLFGISYDFDPNTPTPAFLVE